MSDYVFPVYSGHRYDYSQRADDHKALDISWSGCEGWLVWSCHEGTVSWVLNNNNHYDYTGSGSNRELAIQNSNDSYGNMVAIRHYDPQLGTTIEVRYAHLQSFDSKMVSGYSVKKGQFIGRIGNTGLTSGAHLHFQMVDAYSGAVIDPLAFSYDSLLAPSSYGEADKKTEDTPTDNTTNKINPTTPNVEDETPSYDYDGGVTLGGDDDSVTSSGTLDITSIKTDSSMITGKAKDKSFGKEQTSVITKGAEILINHGGKYYLPMLEDSITLQRTRNEASTLKFKVVNDRHLPLSCGDIVSFKWNTEKMFYGVIFSIKATSRTELEITAYDSMRYLKNENSYIFKQTTLTKVIKQLCKDNGINVDSKMGDTAYKFTLSIDKKSGLDWIDAAMTKTTRGNSKEYVVYDDFGTIKLSQMVPFVAVKKKVKGKTVTTYSTTMLGSAFIDNSQIQGFTYEATIDDLSSTSTQLKLAYDDGTTGKRMIYVYNAPTAQSKFGKLVYYSDKDVWSDKKIRDAYYKIWKSKNTNASKKYSVKGAIGATDVRGGTYIPVSVDIGMYNSSEYKSCTLLLVEDAKHTFANGYHTMDLTLRGGQYDI